MYSGPPHKGHPKIFNKDRAVRSQVTKDHAFYPLKRVHLGHFPLISDTFLWPSGVLLRRFYCTNVWYSTQCYNKLFYYLMILVCAMVGRGWLSLPMTFQQSFTEKAVSCSSFCFSSRSRSFTASSPPLITFLTSARDKLLFHLVCQEAPAVGTLALVTRARLSG